MIKTLILALAVTGCAAAPDPATETIGQDLLACDPTCDASAIATAWAMAQAFADCFGGGQPVDCGWYAGAPTNLAVCSVGGTNVSCSLIYSPLNGRIVEQGCSAP